MKQHSVNPICENYLESLERYNQRYFNYCITGFVNLSNPYITRRRYPITLNQLKSDLIYGNGYPRISSTPLGVSSLYNRFPVFDLSQYQTSRI